MKEKAEVLPITSRHDGILPMLRLNVAEKVIITQAAQKCPDARLPKF
jgi:hypothetical protein